MSKGRVAAICRPCRTIGETIRPHESPSACPVCGLPRTWAKLYNWGVTRVPRPGAAR